MVRRASPWTHIPKPKPLFFLQQQRWWNSLAVVKASFCRHPLTQLARRWEGESLSCRRSLDLCPVSITVPRPLAAADSPPPRAQTSGSVLCNLGIKVRGSIQRGVSEGKERKGKRIKKERNTLMGKEKGKERKKIKKKRNSMEKERIEKQKTKERKNKKRSE